MLALISLDYSNNRSLRSKWEKISKVVMKMNVVALEVSTSSAKCLLFSLREGIIQSYSVPFSEEVSDTASQDPKGVFAAAMEALTQVVRSTDRKIAAIGLGGTWHSMLLLDKGRRPLGRIRTWADISATPLVNKIKEEDPKRVRVCYHKTGCMVHAIYPAWKYLYLKETQPELVAKTAYLASQIEYVFERLTGKAYLSKCIASGTGFFNINTLDWDEDILREAGLDPGRLGELKKATDTAPLLPEIAAQVSLPSGIPVTVGCADGALNQVGIGGWRERVMSFSVGTSAAIRMVYPEPKIPEEPSTWCYYLDDGKRIAGAATQGACNCLDWYLERVQSGSDAYDYQGFERGVREIGIEKAPYFLPFLFGERCPGWREDRKGGFFDLEAAHTEYDLYYSVLEGTLFNIYQCYRILIELGGAPEEIIISGGIMNSEFWLQMAADIFGRELSTTGYTNDSTVGAALIALQAIGGVERIEDYLPPITGRIAPCPERRELYQKRFQRYLELYKLT